MHRKCGYQATANKRCAKEMKTKKSFCQKIITKLLQQSSKVLEVLSREFTGIHVTLVSARDSLLVGKVGYWDTSKTKQERASKFSDLRPLKS